MIKKIQSATKDFDLNPIGIGTMGFGGYFSRDLENNQGQVRLIEAAYDLGVNVVDTAEVYGEGAAEETIGKTSANVRNNLFIMSKFSPENSSSDNIRKSVDNSLKRIKREYLDVYQPHWPQPGVRLDDTLGTLEDLKLAGKIRFAGLSNFPLSHLSSLDIGRFPSLRFFQCEFNPIEKSIAEGLLPLVNNLDGALIAYSPFREGQIFKSEKFAEFQVFCDSLGFMPSQVLLAWGVFNGKTIVIPKVSSLKHLKDNIDSIKVNLSSTDVDYVSNLFAPKIRKILPSEVIPDIPVKEDQRKIYRNIHEAKLNIYNLNPGPMEIVTEIEDNAGKLYKPIKVEKKNREGQYVLVDGRLRFWAWVILFGWNKPIDAVIVDSLN